MGNKKLESLWPILPHPTNGMYELTSNFNNLSTENNHETPAKSKTEDKPQ